MNNDAILGKDNVEELLVALAEQLTALGERHTIAVVGGSALIALGLVPRTTRDIDVLALHDGQRLVSAEPLPDGLARAAELVAADFDLPADWLNAGPASLVDFDLPRGFLKRAERRRYGLSLGVLFASRLDQIHLKLYAVVDEGAGKHLNDLRALDPNEEELLLAADWSETHDPSEPYREELSKVLAYLGVQGGPPRS